MQPKRFQRRIEDFVCAHCGHTTTGSGYTNHCPRCLWSRHVDINPGDRAEACGGMMEPIGIEGSTPTYRIIHSCTVCGAIRKVRVASDDDLEAVARVAGT